MNLAQTIEALQKRPLTQEEMSMLNEFQRQFSVDDEDPILVVLAMMARSQLILESAPTLLQQKVTETIELHRSLLREQSVLIAKELISELVSQLQVQQKQGKSIWVRHLASFSAGIAMTFAIVLMAHFFVR